MEDIIRTSGSESHIFAVAVVYLEFTYIWTLKRHPDF